MVRQSRIIPILRVRAAIVKLFAMDDYQNELRMDILSFGSHSAVTQRWSDREPAGLLGYDATKRDCYGRAV